MSATTRELSEFVAGLSYDMLPVEIPGRVKALALDTVGIMLRARNDAESTPALVDSAALLGFTGGACTVVGDAAGYTPPGAAMLNGTLAHSLDFDDTHATGSLHPSAPIMPAAFAGAEMSNADGKALIAAIVAGYETQIRLALALDPAAHYDRGFHPSATCGAFGAAAAAGRLLGLDASRQQHAFGIVLSMRSRSASPSWDGKSSAIPKPRNSLRNRSSTASSRWLSARRSRCEAAASCGTTTRNTCPIRQRSTFAERCARVSTLAHRPIFPRR